MLYTILITAAEAVFLLSLQQPMLWSHWAVVECCWTRDRRRLLGLSFLLWPPPASMAGALLLCRRCRPRNACAYCEHSILWQPLSIVRRAHARPLCRLCCVQLVYNMERRRGFPAPRPRRWLSRESRVCHCGHCQDGGSGQTSIEWMTDQ